MPTSKKAGKPQPTTTRLSTTINPDLYKRVKIAAITHDMTVHGVIEEALSEWLAAHKA